MSSDSKIKAARLSIISNSLLIAFKLGVGFFIGSVSILSEAIHSAIDLLAALLAYFAVKSSSEPADREHAYGHGKFENISGFLEAILIFGAAGWIIYEAVKKFMNPGEIRLIGLGIFVMAFSSIVNFLVSRKLFKVAEASDSIAIKADAWHLRTDVWTSVGVMAGLFIIWLCSVVSPRCNLYWLDPVIACLVALMIIKAAYDLTQQSVNDLLDASLPEKELEKIAGIIKTHEAVISFKNLKTRKSGAIRFIDFDLLVDGKISIENAHSVADSIAGRIESEMKQAKVMIHIEPCAVPCAEECADHCKKPAK